MYLIFDTETASFLDRTRPEPPEFSKDWPRLLQLAWIGYDESEGELLRNSHIIKPCGFEVTEEAANYHGITNERALREGKPLRGVLDGFLMALKESEYLISHNMDFDKNIVGAELGRLEFIDEQKWLKDINKFCTMKGSTDFCQIPWGPDGGYKFPKLPKLCELLGIEFEETHNALNDSEACAKCFFELKKRDILRL